MTRQTPPRIQTELNGYMSTIWAETLLLIETTDIGVIYYEFTPYDLRREYQKSYYSSPKEDKKAFGIILSVLQL